MLVRKLVLEKHHVGGYFKQTYRSDTIVNIEGYDGQRNISTAIYYMLVGEQFSAFHMIRSDEIWHYYAGGPIILYAIDNKSKLSRIKIGKSGMPQAIIKAGTWFAAALESRKSYCLLGCTVSPGCLAAPYRRALTTATGSLARGTSLPVCIKSIRS